MPNKKVSTTEKRAELEAKGEPWPVCDCCGLKKMWSAESGRESGGKWRLLCSNRAAQKRYRQRRRALGVCVNHPDRPAVGETRCQECLDRGKLYNRQRYETLKESGLCVVCGGRSYPGLTLCTPCHMRWQSCRRRRRLSQSIARKKEQLAYFEEVLGQLAEELGTTKEKLYAQAG